MSDLEDRLRAYLDALLPSRDVPEVLRRALAADDPFPRAHELLHDRVRVTTEVEVDVLTEDAGLPLDEAATVIGVSETEARSAKAAVEEVAAELSRESLAPRTPIVIVDDTGEPLVLPDERTRRRIWPWLLLAIVLVTGVSALVFTYGEDPCDAVIREAPDAPIAVRRACVTHEVDLAGRPAAPRHTFALQEPVVFWFSYDLRTGEDFLLSLVVTRDGEELQPQPQFPPPDNCDGPCEQAHVTIPSDLVDEVGEYTVEVRWQDRTLAAGDFRVVRATG